MQIKPRQVAVITGAGSGIGAALAKACARQGMRIVAADIEENAAQKTVEEIRESGTEALAFQVDVAHRDSVMALARKCWEQFGGCNLLCNNAGVSVNRPLSECSASDWQWVWSVNVAGIANAIEAFVPHMQRQQEASHIVNTASMAGLIPLPDFGPYVASKYAVVGLSEVLSQELKRDGIGVSILCPGMVDTRIFESERNRPDRKPFTGSESEYPSAMATDEKDMQTDFDSAYTRILSPEHVADLTLEAVSNNQLYVATHPEWYELFRQRAEAIRTAFNSNQYAPD